MKSRIFLLVLATMLAMLPAFSAFAESGYVTVTLTFHPDYIASGSDADARIAQAKADMSQPFASVADAEAAFDNLFLSSGGTYTGGSYTTIGPLYYAASSNPSIAQRTPLKGVEYVVHGTVPFGTSNHLSLASVPAMQSYVSSVTLRGADSSASITGSVNVSANVAGGYEETFVNAGTFTVKDIIFTNTTGNTAIAANGQSNTNEKKAETVHMVIEGCSFSNCLYSYVNDRSTKNLNTTIRSNTFDGNGLNSNAIFLQPTQDVEGSGTTVIENNTIQNYAQGVNIQGRNNADVTVKGNTVRNLTDPDRQFVQFTSGKTFTVENNNVSGVAGNVFRVHSLASGVIESIVIKNNNIDESAYLLWNQAANVPVSVSGNTILNTNVTQYYDKDAKKVENHPVDTAAAFVKNNTLTADETRIENEPVSVPQTGDNSQIALWIVLMTVSTAFLVALGRKFRFN